MKNYLELMYKILTSGDIRRNWNGEGVFSIFGEQLKFELEDSFPVVDTKYIHFESIRNELNDLIKAQSNTLLLNNIGVLQGDGRSSVDNNPIKIFLEKLRKNPFSKRHVLSTDSEFLSTEPPHKMYQFYIEQTEYEAYVVNHLSCNMYQLSCDYFLQAPVEIALCALLIEAICIALSDETSHWKPKKLIVSYGEMHIRTKFMNQCREQLGRVPVGKTPPLNFPVLQCEGESLVDRLLFAINNLELLGYKKPPSSPPLKSEDFIPF